MRPLDLLWTFLILAVIYIFLIRNTKYVIEGLDANNAADLCRQISSEADNIRAKAKGDAELAKNVIHAFSPLNAIIDAAKGGDNEIETELRNIMDTSISPEVKTQITNTCNNVASSIMSNVIDNTQCEYCKKNECPISNVTQENVSSSQQDCILNSIVTNLLKAQNDTNSQALAEAIQKSQGALSGDNTKSDNMCNIVNTNISPKSYLESINQCANQIDNDLKNELKGCAAVTNVIQRNQIQNLQACITSATTDTKLDIENKADVGSGSTSNQSSEGISQWASLGSFFSLCIGCIVCSLIVGFVSNTATERIAQNPEIIRSIGGMNEDI